jgi:hypothetical protein
MAQHCLQILDWASEMLWDIQAGKWYIKAFQEAIFMSVLAVAQWIHI